MLYDFRVSLGFSLTLMKVFSFSVACGSVQELYSKLLSTPFDFNGLEYELVLNEMDNLQEEIKMQFSRVGAVYNSISPAFRVYYSHDAFKIEFHPEFKKQRQIKEKQQDSIVLIDLSGKFSPVYSEAVPSFSPLLEKQSKEYKNGQKSFSCLKIRENPVDNGYCEQCQIYFKKAKIHRISDLHVNKSVYSAKWAIVDKLLGV